MVTKIRFDIDVRDLIEKNGKSNWITTEMVLSDERWNSLWDDVIGDMVKDSIQSYLANNGFGGDSLDDRIFDYNVDKIINGDDVAKKK